jgi:hypothetical protein
MRAHDQSPEKACIKVQWACSRSYLLHSDTFCFVFIFNNYVVLYLKWDANIIYLD